MAAWAGAAAAQAGGSSSAATGGSSSAAMGGSSSAVYDEITGAALPPDLVRQARAEELKFMRDWGVWKRASIA